MKHKDDILITSEVREFLLDIGDHLATTHEEAVELTVNNDVGVEYNIICWFSNFPKMVEVEFDDIWEDDGYE